jgi:tRNA threonylcarbamoyladenosine biosynthesis protein TsaB
MQRALAIETSGRVGSIAVVGDGVVVAEEEFPHGLQHAAQIVPIIDRLIGAQGWKPRDVEQLYVSQGPGSFTGLRIGITLAKTMALATGVKIVAVPSLRVLVENAPAEARHVIIVLDAKRDQIFTARYERAEVNEWIERDPPQLSSLKEMLSRSPRPVNLLGEGIPYHQKFVPMSGDIIVTSSETWHARASSVAKIGIALARKGQFADPFKLTPIYIRRPEAEEKYLQQHPRV